MPARRIEFMASIWTSYLTAFISAVNSAIPFVPCRLVLVFTTTHYSRLSFSNLLQAARFLSGLVRSRLRKRDFFLLVDGMGGGGGAADGTDLGRSTATEPGKASKAGDRNEPLPLPLPLPDPKAT
jgi:hypothetical protein